ncbi:hypothetical protein SARC_11459 [Sphaeroforma arctica JP610]|uniref:Cationic amino acid transporter C-terminal domain-containing protein n=1 Tax=Sphaeroforma arctica JP610 TaxID=667725 RepID=A0A0L0FGX3_9EUKA|nr:hypothetical protein SARC_11459 [Sphaeroforma arctica JP610]KNC76029.1 hypothetical protein SARC_11459 [Sphaeroforma arctica JP610]|eukprot:XP_014149931.1 hypothetical protein SARC_11459 [Sphaeroforma arctica JP610]
MGFEEIMGKMSRKKPAHIILAQEAVHEESGIVKLSLFDLLCIGIGCTIGSGVFVLTGDVLTVSGPSAVVSWLIAGFICLLSGFSYMELSSRVPTSGSCYSYAYFGLGEAMGFLGGICLTLEYGISGAGVARSWSAKIIYTVENFTGYSMSYFHIDYPGNDGDIDAYVDLLAGIVMALSVIILAVGLKMGKVVINAFTIAKVCLVTFMIICGLASWTQSGYGFDAYSSTDEFLPFGIGGMLLGASKLFFGFIGFDEVACLAGRSNNPRKTMPLAIGGTLLAATVISTLAQFALGGAVIPCETHPTWDAENPDAAPCSEIPSFSEAFLLVGWTWASYIVAWGEAILLPIVVLLSFIAQPELMAAMAIDGMLPIIFAKENKEGNLTMGTIISGIAMTLIAMLVPFDILWDMISLGVLLSFCITNTSLIAVRLSGSNGNTKVTGCLLYVWVAGFISAYMLWKGYLEEYFNIDIPDDEKDLNDVILWIAVALAASVVGILIIMSFMFKETDESKAEKGRVFRSPLVPLLPGIGIYLNAFLMSQISWMNLLYLVCAIVAGYLWYFAYGIRNSAREFDDDASSDLPKGRHSRRPSEYIADALTGETHKKDLDDMDMAESQVELDEK